MKVEVEMSHAIGMSNIKYVFVHYKVIERCW